MSRVEAIARLHEEWWDTDGRADLNSDPGHESDFIAAMRTLGVSDEEMIEAGCERRLLLSKPAFEALVKLVDDQLGNLQMTWEGPWPHDFRPENKARGTRFVHSCLFNQMYEDCLGGKIQFRVLASDSAAIELGARITAAGYDWTIGESNGDYAAITFEVAL